MSMGSRIKAVRESRGMSRENLAQLLNITVSSVSNYENDISTPKEPILISLMAALGIDANYLFHDEMIEANNKNAPSTEAPGVNNDDQLLSLKKKELLDRFANLSIEDMQKMIEYAEFLKSRHN